MSVDELSARRAQMREKKQENTRKERKKPDKVKQPVDYSILIAIIGIVCFGLIMVYSASYYSAENTSYRDSAEYYFYKQLLGAALGFVGMAFFALWDYHNLAKYKWLLIGASIVLLIGVFIPGIGITIHGSSRWINLRVMTFQPSEAVKFAIIVFVASTVSANPKKLHDLWHGFMPYLMLLGIYVVLIYKQPNMSAIICITLLLFAMLVVGGAKMKHILVLGGIGAGVLAVLLFASAIFGDEEGAYRIARVVSFTNPFDYADDQGYQVVQSLYAIGGGGLFGRGLGNSVQKLLFLPFSESDFIFAIVAEELGLVGASLMILAFAFLVWRGIRVATNAPDMMGMLLVTGIMAIITIQTVIHIAVCTSSMPPTGVALPFVSYGSSGLIIFMSMIGIVLNVSRHVRKA